MHPKIIVLDLDGTLLNSKKQISERNLLALQKVKEKGIHLIFATARPPRAVNYEGVNLHALGSVVFYNGALFRCEMTNQEIHYSISKAIVASLFDYCLSLEPNANISVEVKNEWLSFKSLDYLQMMNTTSNPAIISMEELINYDCTKILITDCNILEQLTKKFSHKVNIVSTDNGTIVQIMAIEASKENAVEYITKTLGYSMHEVMCFGDDYNDWGMFQACGHSVAMGNAIHELKQIATETTDTNDNDGVASVLEKINNAV